MNKIKNGTFGAREGDRNITLSSLHLLDDVGGYLQGQVYNGYVGSLGKGEL